MQKVKLHVYTSFVLSDATNYFYLCEYFSIIPVNVMCNWMLDTVACEGSVHRWSKQAPK